MLQFPYSGVKPQSIEFAMLRIPVTAYLITLLVREYEIQTRRVRVGRETREQRQRVETRREVSNRHSERSTRQAVQVANEILAQADIEFTLKACVSQRVDMPFNSDTVTPQGFLFLARMFPAANSATLLMVDRFSGHELGGQAAEELGVCIASWQGHPGTGHVVAHEFGHLLGLDHLPHEASRARYNLMWPALRAGHELTDDQRQAARQSRLAHRFNGSN